jgi:phosphorylase kinase alpha/beta subunit
MSTKLQRRASVSVARSRSIESPDMTLDDYYHTVAKTILCNQNPLTGLFSAGKDTDHAWVRDNVYAIMSIWGLSLSYKKHLDQMENWTKCYELEQVIDRRRNSN